MEVFVSISKFSPYEKYGEVGGLLSVEPLGSAKSLSVASGPLLDRFVWNSLLQIFNRPVVVVTVSLSKRKLVFLTIPLYPGVWNSPTFVVPIPIYVPCLTKSIS